MNAERPLTLFERRILISFLGIMPALGIGFYSGGWASAVGTGNDSISVFERALIGAAFPALFAFFAPKSWILPSLFHAWGFYFGYILRDDLSSNLSQAFARLTGDRSYSSEPQAHPELWWMFGFALWLSAFVAFLRSRKGQLERVQPASKPEAWEK